MTSTLPLQTTTTDTVSYKGDYALQVATPKLHHHSDDRLKEEKTEIADDKSQKMIDNIFRLISDCAFYAILSIPTTKGRDLRCKVSCLYPVPDIFQAVERITGKPQSSFGIKHKDRQIFSSDGKKRSLLEYGIYGNEVITVYYIFPSPSIDTSSPIQETSISVSHINAKAESVQERPSKRRSPSPDQETPTQSKISEPAQPRSPQRRSPWRGGIVEKKPEDFKLEHSKKLEDIIWKEADPKFREIRKRLNDGAIQRTEAKIEHDKNNPTPKGSSEPSVLGSNGLGDEAVNGSTIVNVGEIQNLYKTSKQSKLNNSRPHFDVDLHGLNSKDARKKLDDSLPKWIDAAMKGEHPYVIRVKIIHGKGKQILSGMVEQWIKDHRQVTKAPKP